MEVQLRTSSCGLDLYTKIYFLCLLLSGHSAVFPPVADDWDGKELLTISVTSSSPRSSPSVP